jgi:hypothetical protein
MAQGSARNRVLLHQEGVWPLLVRTLLRDYDSEGRLFEEEVRQMKGWEGRRGAVGLDGGSE